MTPMAARQHSPIDDLRELRGILALADLTTSERIVLMAIVLHRNGKDGRCDPSVPTLAQETGLGRRTVQGVIQRLQLERGYLLCNRREGRSTCYSVSVPTPAIDAPPRQVHPRSASGGPTQQVHPTPAAAAPERAKERAKERTNMGERSFPRLKKLPRDGRLRIYPPEFEGAFSALPQRHRSHPKPASYKAWRAHASQDVAELFQLEAAAEAYGEDCEAREIVSTAFVMQAARFFGPGGEWEPYSGVDGSAARGSWEDEL